MPDLATDATQIRRVTVTPTLCGHNSLLIGRIGDWTWESVGRACGLDVTNAKTSSGRPALLVFHYFRVLGSATTHPLSLTFGDRLEVRTRVYGSGRAEVRTIHQITVGGSDCMYVENVNRWVTRLDPGDNASLVAATPVGFRHEHLPKASRASTSRAASARAVRTGSLVTVEDSGERRIVVEGFGSEYPIDLTRDVNGVGIIHFASFFDIVNRSVLACWRHLGRDDTEFLRRRVVDQQMCYLGNADPHATLTSTVTVLEHRDDPSDEMFDVAVRHSGTGRLLAVSLLRVLHAEQRRAAPQPLTSPVGFDDDLESRPQCPRS